MKHGTVILPDWLRLPVCGGLLAVSQLVVSGYETSWTTNMSSLVFSNSYCPPYPKGLWHDYLVANYNNTNDYFVEFGCQMAPLPVTDVVTNGWKYGNYGGNTNAVLYTVREQAVLTTNNAGVLMGEIQNLPQNWWTNLPSDGSYAAIGPDNWGSQSGIGITWGTGSVVTGAGGYDVRTNIGSAASVPVYYHLKYRQQTNVSLQWGIVKYTGIRTGYYNVTTNGLGWVMATPLASSVLYYTNGYYITVYDLIPRTFDSGWTNGQHGKWVYGQWQQGGYVESPTVQATNYVYDTTIFSNYLNSLNGN